ncbi:MAG: hypothetical protein CM1200mP18_13070 [Gammaproteobacteria bacterium]|nr:MAG: hypothetical protein CM1200mP18_13070 [Gammaproteobacteria bacterium]
MSVSTNPGRYHRQGYCLCTITAIVRLRANIPALEARSASDGYCRLVCRSARNIDQHAATDFTKMGDGATAQLGGGQQIDTQCSLPVVKPAIKNLDQGVISRNTGVVD